VSAHGTDLDPILNNKNGDSLQIDSANFCLYITGIDPKLNDRFVVIIDQFIIGFDFKPMMEFRFLQEQLKFFHQRNR